MHLYEAETREEAIEAMQQGINDGSIWRMEGAMGRAAMSALHAGECMLGEVGHRDYWGNYVPSRHEVEPGTLGSVEYCEAHNWGEVE